MGQKINPLGFRLGITQNHRSYWFAKPKKYSKVFEEDKKIRDCIELYVQKHIKNSSNYGGIARVEIKRKTDLIQVEIYTGFPALLVESRGQGIEQLKLNVQNILSSGDRRLRMTLIEIAKPYGEPNILAEYIALQLESRVAFRRTMKKAIELAKKGNIKGIKIQIAGRLNGAEIARVEWAREGRVPLQTIRARINYCYYAAQTIYGVLGIKVWIFQDEE
ncbi:ribosomal protein S3 (chloroplast) [Marchantia polymorpha subsp. ruderalis]|uniref:Small ribosomal subunit protein uS3c n=3 Tax=Marchantia polymorpha TaxID=3197 RepID=A0A2Z6DT74_MARPO|nr:ribosomal protein S3 [Marchantia polymorpha subsp. ruderalis]YP_009646851.1 ribosomal protein S3 [Marchantia polymorpha]AXJ93253.1 ribosomal protein S3 [Marchantia polymorpha subsp. ruderalis]AZU95203.1 ribosomal protein S3 [Marchantia polymorpha]QBE89591.1 ribosomal protein S3 [Marchantia polymorpha subsp. ruderalis]BBD75117.1 ribosomal protein S3 [Marchantia polymorpha subsp. ruderalis]BDD77300.1 ribosomal protein S3 [Marchantia polymorpha subsp. ruderalis]